MAPSTTSQNYDEPPPYNTRDPRDAREPSSTSSTTSDSRYLSQNQQTDNHGYGYGERSEPAMGRRDLGILGGRREGRRGGRNGGGGLLQRHREKKAARREGLMSLVGGVMGRK
ncbi:hypothetical protein BDZ45DRAFT_424984 [Acephala macrosclerotiorum]|nr:hypothetical protein BDZ45DRAFT_424984 [Acephala macrosclerotiorum]